MVLVVMEVEPLLLLTAVTTAAGDGSGATADYRDSPCCSYLLSYQQRPK